MKKYISDFEIHLGHLTMKGALYPLQRSIVRGKGDGSYSIVGPNGEMLRRVWVIDETGETVDDELTQRVKVNEDNTTTMVNKDAIAAAREATIPKNHMVLRIHDAKEVDDIWADESGKSFVFYPNPEMEMWAEAADTLAQKLAQGKKVALAEVNLRGHQRLYRLVAWRGYLVLQPHCYSDGVNDHEPRKPKVRREVSQLMDSILDGFSAEFDPESYINAKLDRLRAAEAVEAGEVDAAALFSQVSDKEPQQDLMDILRSTLAEASN